MWVDRRVKLRVDSGYVVGRCDPDGISRWDVLETARDCMQIVRYAKGDQVSTGLWV